MCSLRRKGVNEFKKTKGPKLLKKNTQIESLFNFKCKLTHNMQVFCFSWHRNNKDILAVGYGGYGHVDRDKYAIGMVLFWSLCNPSFPEKHFHTSFGVIALEFTETKPGLLAVGMYNSSIAIYDTSGRNTQDLH